MSKKKKSRARPPTSASRRQQSRLLQKLNTATEQSITDGYTNTAAFLGENSDLISSGSFRRTDLTRMTETLTAAYRTSWLVIRIIDMPSEDIKVETSLRATVSKSPATTAVFAAAKPAKVSGKKIQ